LVSHEHGKIGLFTLAEIAHPNVPQGYKDSTVTWFARLATSLARVGYQGCTMYDRRPNAGARYWLMISVVGPRNRCMTHQHETEPPRSRVAAR